MKKLFTIVTVGMLLSTAAFAAQDVATGAKVTGVAAAKTGKATGKAGFAVVKNVAKDAFGFVKFETVGAFHGVKRVGGQLKRAVKA
jgi:hypothetical protein